MEFLLNNCGSKNLVLEATYISYKTHILYFTLGASMAKKKNTNRIQILGQRAESAKQASRMQQEHRTERSHDDVGLNLLPVA